MLGASTLLLPVLRIATLLKLESLEASFRFFTELFIIKLVAT